MGLSEAERRRRMEEEDAKPYIRGYTCGQFYSLPEREQDNLRQWFSQHGATYVGMWKTCSLGKCRRARRCIGFLSDAQYERSRLRAYPPCTREDEPTRARILAGIEALVLQRFGPTEPDELKYDGRRASERDDD